MDFRPAAALSLALAAGLAHAGEFTVIALPDTQNYVTSSTNAELFTQQTQWIADQIGTEGNPENIVFVTHLGDVVSSGDSLTQLQRADTSLSVLDGVIPWSVLPGNHDYADTGSKGTGTDDYLDFFGPARFAGQSWFGGSDNSGNNTFQYFQGEGQTYLHIALEWRPTENVTNGPTRDPSPVEWAQQVIRDNPGLPVIISTHEHIDDEPAGRSGAGEALWNQLIRKNDQVIMILNGHYHSVGGSNDGEYHQVSQNDFGKPVIEVLQDYQDYPNGGDGWLRIITFDTDADLVKFRTYSPALDQFQTETVAQVGGFASQFDLTLDFTNRFDFEPAPEPPVEIFDTVSFQQGVDGYNGTEDKEIRSTGGDEANGDADEISIDGDDGSPGLQPNQALVRFNNIIGNGVSQLAAGSDITSALLELTVTNPGSGAIVYRMTAPWDESTTWASLGGDGVTVGTDADSTPVVAVGGNNSSSNVGEGLLALDVTGAVEDWANGAANQGLALVPFTNGTNGIDFDSSEGSSPPRLLIRTLKPEFLASTFRQGEDDYSGAADTQIREEEPTEEYGTVPSVSVDSSDPSYLQNHILIRFDDLFGAGGVPTDREIVRALLTVRADNPGDGAAVHRLLQDWNDEATWGGSFGGDGVQADDADAIATPDTIVSGGTGSIEIDVTASLIAWQADPSSNFGWVLLPLGSNGWDFFTAEAGSIPNRPQLTVVYQAIAPCTPDVTTDGTNPGDADYGIPDGIVTTADLTYFVEQWIAGNLITDVTTDGSNPGDAGFGAPDGDVTIADLTFFVEAWVAGCP